MTIEIFIGYTASPLRALGVVLNDEISAGVKDDQGRLAGCSYEKGR